MQMLYSKEVAVRAAQEVNRLILDAMIAVGRDAPFIAATAFGCSERVVTRLRELSESPRGASIILALGRCPQSLFKIAISDELELSAPPKDPRGFDVSSKLDLLRRVNRMVLLAATRASSTDETALLGLGIAPPLADALRESHCGMLMASIEAAEWSIAQPRFGAEWLDRVAALDDQDHCLIPYFGAALADEDDVRPVKASLYRTGGEMRRGRYVDTDLRLAMLARYAGSNGATTQLAEIIFGAEANNSVVRGILRAHLKSREATNVDSALKRSWTASHAGRLLGAGVALMLVRLIRAGFPVAEAALLAFEHHKSLQEAAGRPELSLRLRDMVLNLLVPVVNRRATLQLQAELNSAWLVVLAENAQLIGVVCPQVMLTRRRSATNAPDVVSPAENAASLRKPVLSQLMQ